MSRVIVLDSGVLGDVVKPVRKRQTDFAIAQWVVDLSIAGNRLVVPAIADYELRRELLRIKRFSSILALDLWNAGEPGRFLDITRADLLLACDFWAQARNAGRPTADSKELDGDVLICAQARNLGLPASDYIVATTNVRHISQFVPADLWSNIAP